MCPTITIYILVKSEFEYKPLCMSNVISIYDISSPLAFSYCTYVCIYFALLLTWMHLEASFCGWSHDDIYIANNESI